MTILWCAYKISWNYHIEFLTKQTDKQVRTVKCHNLTSTSWPQRVQNTWKHSTPAPPYQIITCKRKVIHSANDPIHQWLIQPMSPFINDSFIQWPPFNQWPPFTNDSFSQWPPFTNDSFIQWVPFTNDSINQWPHSTMTLSTNNPHSQWSHSLMTHSASDPYSPRTSFNDSFCKWSHSPIIHLVNDSIC